VTVGLSIGDRLEAALLTAVLVFALYPIGRLFAAMLGLDTLAEALGYMFGSFIYDFSRHRCTAAIIIMIWWLFWD